MDFRESVEDVAFRTEVREFVEKNLAADIRERVLGFRRVHRQDYLTWQKVLHAGRSIHGKEKVPASLL